MNVILSIAKYTNNHMKLNWSNYDLSDSFDEYISSKKSVRRHIKKIGNFFESLSSTPMYIISLNIINNFQMIYILIIILSFHVTNVILKEEIKIVKNLNYLKI